MTSQGNCGVKRKTPQPLFLASRYGGTLYLKYSTTAIPRSFKRVIDLLEIRGSACTLDKIEIFHFYNCGYFDASVTIPTVSFSAEPKRRKNPIKATLSLSYFSEILKKKKFFYNGSSSTSPHCPTAKPDKNSELTTIPLPKKQSKPTLRETYLKTQDSNPSQLGDPISLKAETSNTSPMPHEAGASSSSSSSPPPKTSGTKNEIKTTAPAPTEGDLGSNAITPAESKSQAKGKGTENSNRNEDGNTRVGKEKSALGDGGTGGHADGKKTLRERAMETLEGNPSQLGDPVSLKAEKGHSEPTGGDTGAEGGGGVRKAKGKAKL
jgi:hypothetical protein